MPAFRQATSADIPSVLPMMQSFYEFEGIPYNQERSARLLTQIVSDAHFGRLMLIEHEGKLAGYMILGFGFSVEFGGRDALLDELFIQPEFRSKGLGTAAIESAQALCKALQIEALHLEADHFNDRAHDLYLRLGFKDHKRHLMTKWL